MTNLVHLKNFKGIRAVFENEQVTLYRAVDAALGCARWVYQARQPVATPELFAKSDPVSPVHHKQWHYLPIRQVGLDSRDRPFLVVEQADGVPLAGVIDNGFICESQLLMILLSIVRTLKSDPATHCGVIVLDPAFVFLANAAGQNRPQKVAAAHWVMMDPLWVPSFTAHPVCEPTPASLLDHCMGLARTCLAQPQALQSVLEEVAQDAGRLTWFAIEQILIKRLAGRHMVATPAPFYSALCGYLSEQRPQWQLLDCQKWGQAPWWRCALFNAEDDRWCWAWVTHSDRREAKKTLRQFADLAGFPGQYQLRDHWWFGTRERAWVALIDDYPHCDLLSDLAVPLSSSRVRHTMARLCQQVSDLDSVGIVVDGVLIQRIALVDQEPLLLPLSPLEHLSPVSSSNGVVDGQIASDPAAALAALAVHLMTGQPPRWYRDELQMGASFKRVPEDLRAVIRQCLSPKKVTAHGGRSGGNRLSGLAALAQALALPSATPAKGDAPSADQPEQARREHHKKILLLLLLILLFQTLVNVGIIVVFQ